MDVFDELEVCPDYTKFINAIYGEENLTTMKTNKELIALFEDIELLIIELHYCWFKKSNNHKHIKFIIADMFKLIAKFYSIKNNIL